MEAFEVRAAAFIVVMALAIAVNATVGGEEDLSAYYGFGEIEMVRLDWGVMCLRVADLNGDGRNDMVIANNAKARIELLLQKADVGLDDPAVTVDPNDIDVNTLTLPTRFEKIGLPVSQKMHSLVCGDLDGDGTVDLAFYGDPAGLYVIRQKPGGDRSTISWRTPERIAVEDGLETANALRCADLNNDGRSDLVLAGRQQLYVLLQTPDGDLAQATQYPTMALTLRVEVADLNGDGISDIVLVTNDGQKPLHVRLGLPTGHFGPQLSLAIEKPQALCLHNIDGGPGDEVLAVDAVSGRLLCYGYSAGGESDDWSVLTYPLAAGQSSSKRDLVLADVTGDALSDVVISDPATAEVILYRQVGGVGLAEPVRFPSFAEISSIAAARMDDTGNGKVALAVLSVKEKAIGLCGFDEGRITFPTLLDTVGEPLAMDLADMDGDGRTDCVYVSKADGDKWQLHVALKIGSADADTQTDAGWSADLPGLKANPDSIKVIDVDQDGLPDVLIFASYELPVLARQVEAGRFEIVDRPQARMSLLKDAQLRTVFKADVDGRQGDELLVAQKSFARSLVFEGAEQWKVVDQYNASGSDDELLAVAAFAWNGPSSRPSILLLEGRKGKLQILDAGADNTYRLSRALDVGSWNAATHLKILSAPLTGGSQHSVLLFDGAKFAVVTPPTADGYRGTLDRRFGYETLIKNGAYGNLAAGDVNGDGWTDLVMLDSRNSYMEILALDGDVRPVPAMRFKIFEEKSYQEQRLTPRAGIEPRELVIADVTGNGKDDLVMVIHDRIILYPQD
ncbi:MAG TPA: VCBS repeat-containing protein [Phycisphaerales bacterium]|nr:VCBS repeat-containing protein [Phycisphaerales bacterium]